MVRDSRAGVDKNAHMLQISYRGRMLSMTRDKSDGMGIVIPRCIPIPGVPAMRRCCKDGDAATMLLNSMEFGPTRSNYMSSLVKRGKEKEGQCSPTPRSLTADSRGLPPEKMRGMDASEPTGSHVR